MSRKGGKDEEMRGPRLAKKERMRRDRLHLKTVKSTAPDEPNLQFLDIKPKAKVKDLTGWSEMPKKWSGKAAIDDPTPTMSQSFKPCVLSAFNTLKKTLKEANLAYEIRLPKESMSVRHPESSVRDLEIYDSTGRMLFAIATQNKATGSANRHGNKRRNHLFVIQLGQETHIDVLDSDTKSHLVMIRVREPPRPDSDDDGWIEMIYVLGLYETLPVIVPLPDFVSHEPEPQQTDPPLTLARYRTQSVLFWSGKADKSQRVVLSPYTPHREWGPIFVTQRYVFTPIDAKAHSHLPSFKRWPRRDCIVSRTRPFVNRAGPLDAICDKQSEYEYSYRFRPIYKGTIGKLHLSNWHYCDQAVESSVQVDYPSAEHHSKDKAGYFTFHRPLASFVI